MGVPRGHNTYHELSLAHGTLRTASDGAADRYGRVIVKGLWLDRKIR